MFINMVASVDGRTAVEGKASGLGAAADRGVMRTLRSRADAVMVGGGTLRAEKLSLGLDPEDPRPRPLAVILTSTGDVPLERNLVLDPRQDVLVLLSEAAGNGAEQRLGRRAEVRRVPATGSGAIDLARALKIMEADYGIELLLCEGGPTLVRALISAGLAAELFITLAPALIGRAASDAPGTPKGPPEGPKAPGPKVLRLVSAHPVRDELFLRYALSPDKPSD